MDNNFYTLFQYFTGRITLRDNELNFYSIFQNNNSLIDECAFIDKVGILLKQSTFGCMVIFDNEKSYSPVEIEKNRKFCIALFHAFTDCASHISVFNTNFNNLLNSENEIKHFFAWIYLPSEKVIRCFNKNCIIKTNSNHTITPKQFFDIPIASLNYLAYAANNFDLDNVTDAIVSSNVSMYDFPISCVNFVPKTALSEDEKNIITKKYRFFYKIKEQEFLGVKITEDEIYLKQFQQLKILEAIKDNNLNSYFKEYFLDKKEIYDAVIAKQINSKQLANSFDKIYKAILENYKEDEQTQTTPPSIDDFSNVWQPYIEPFKGFKELENIISSWKITIKNEEVAESKAHFLRENIDDILQLKKTIDKLGKTKLTPENTKTFDVQNKFVKTKMTFNDIVLNNKKLEELYTLNQTQYPIWLKEQKEINKNRRNKILKFTIIIGVLVLLPILYSNYDYEIKDFASNLFDKKTTETEATEIPTEEVATEVDPTNVPVVDSAVSASAEIKEVENEIINIHGEQFTYTGKVIKGDSGGYIPYQYGWAIFDDGSKYIGKYEYGYRTGLGYITYKSGAEYGGEFYHNSFDGLGKYIYPNGSYYIGEFTNYKNNINGCGRYYDNKDKLILEGLFENGKISKEKSCNIDYDHILKIYNEASVVKK